MQLANGKRELQDTFVARKNGERRRRFANLFFQYKYETALIISEDSYI